MRHALAMFVFCLALPHAAMACMPLHASSGTEGAITLVALSVTVIQLFSGSYYWARMAAVRAASPLYPGLRRRRRIAFGVAGASFAFIFAGLFLSSDAMLVTIIASVLLYYALYALIKIAGLALRLTQRAGDCLHFSNIVSKKSHLTRRVAAAGDVQ